MSLSCLEELLLKASKNSPIFFLAETLNPSTLVAQSGQPGNSTSENLKRAKNLVINHLHSLVDAHSNPELEPRYSLLAPQPCEFISLLSAPTWFAFVMCLTPKFLAARSKETINQLSTLFAFPYTLATGNELQMPAADEGRKQALCVSIGLVRGELKQTLFWNAVSSAISILDSRARARKKRRAAEAAAEAARPA